MRIRVVSFFLLVAAISLLFAGCGANDGDANLVRDREAALNALAGTLNSAVAGANKVIVNGQSTQVVVDTGLVDVPASSGTTARIKQKLQGIQRFTKGISAQRKSRLSAAPDDESFEQDLRAVLDVLMQNAVTDGKTITYTPSTTFCDDNVDTMSTTYADDLADCKAILSHISLVQTVISETSGTLAIKFDAHTPLVIGYAPNSVYFEVDLAGMKGALVGLLQIVEPGTTPQLPETFVGVARITFTSTGVDAGSILVSIQEQIHVAGTFDGQTASVQMAVTEKVIEISADGTAGSGKIELGLNMVDAQFPTTDESTGGNNTLDYPSDLHLGGLTGLLVFDDIAKTLVASNLGLGDGLTHTIEDTEVLAINLVNAFGFTVDGNAGTVTFDATVDLDLTAANNYGANSGLFDNATDPYDSAHTGTFSVDIVNGTVLKPVVNTLSTQGFVKVETLGPVTVNGTGYFDGSMTVNINECFTDNSALTSHKDTGNFPFATATCP